MKPRLHWLQVYLFLPGNAAAALIGDVPDGESAEERKTATAARKAEVSTVSSDGRRKDTYLVRTW